MTVYHSYDLSYLWNNFGVFLYDTITTLLGKTLKLSEAYNQGHCLCSAETYTWILMHDNEQGNKPHSLEEPFSNSACHC